MPENKISDLITDQEMAFARLVLSGTMNDRDAAQSVGLYPDTAAYIKTKPCVCAYMLGHRAAVQQQLAAPETEGPRWSNQRHEQVLDRLWEIANTSAEMTRGSISVQFKALSMIVALDGLIADRRVASSLPQRTSDRPQIHAAECAKQSEKAIHPEPSHTLVQEEEEPGLAEPEPASAANPDSAADAPSESAFANHVSSSETTPSAPHAPLPASAPDARVHFSKKKKRRRR